MRTSVVILYRIHKRGIADEKRRFSVFIYFRKVERKDEVNENLVITENMIKMFGNELTMQEKSQNTISKYIRDIRAFYVFAGRSGSNECLLSKAVVMEYKQHLVENYRMSSVNSMLIAVNQFLKFIGAYDCCVKTIKCQRRIFSEETKELTKQEYERLIAVAKSKNRTQLWLLMETICATGIRVSELQYITVDAARKKRTEIYSKGKSRTIFIPKELSCLLTDYCTEQKIKSGCIFCTANGKPLDRSNIWSAMKSLCHDARVQESKVFPHNLRHLFARTFYGIEKDIVRLADILGHTSTETTRIYTISSGKEHARIVERLGLVI